MLRQSETEAERSARNGKRVFIVRVLNEKRYRVWAEDAQKAEDSIYWRRSSGRPAPEVEDLGDEPQRFIVVD
jgi:hypothetical protein